MLSSLDGVIILDEIQHQPKLFNLLRVLVDRPENRSRFVVLGSASPQLIKQSSETLALGELSSLSFHALISVK